MRSGPRSGKGIELWSTATRAQRQPRIDHKALGIDTGCVYGGKLTAAIFTRAEDWRLVHVKARRQYSR
jgi:hypothetical protein